MKDEGSAPSEDSADGLRGSIQGAPKLLERPPGNREEIFRVPLLLATLLAAFLSFGSTVSTASGMGSLS